MHVTIAFEDVRYGYGATPVLDGVDLTVDRGEFIVLAGANGSGKSTLLKLCVGLLKAQSGSVRVLGGSPDDVSVLRRIGYAPQGLHVVTAIPVAVREVVAAGLAPHAGFRRRDGERGRIETALTAVGMEHLATECLFELSGGQQQRTILARALVADPPLLLLDEPTTGIDQSLRPRLAAELRARADAGTTVVAVSHDPDDFHRVLDRILVISGGRTRELTHDQFHTHFDVS